MTPPLYFHQENKYTCSLAVLRMILNTYGKGVTESELFKKAEKQYGDKFKNIDNTFIVQLATEYKLKVNFIKIPISQIIKLLEENYFIQCSIKMKFLYKNKSGLHSIFLYDYKNNIITYHDPLMGPSLVTTHNDLSKAITGNIILYKKF